MGISFTFVSTFCVIGAKYGYGAVLGAALVGGLLEGLIGMGLSTGADSFLLLFRPVSSRPSGFPS